MNKKKAKEILNKLKDGQHYDKDIVDIALFINGDIHYVPSLKLFRCLPVIDQFNKSLKDKNMNELKNDEYIKDKNKPIAYVCDVKENKAAIISINENRPLKIGMVLFETTTDINTVSLQLKNQRLQKELEGMSKELDRVKALLVEAWENPW
jgi:hypothetical protein